MLTDEIKEFLKHRAFMMVGTCDLDATPNVAPKFFLKLEGEFVFLIDYVIGKTYKNLKINPNISLSIMDLERLTGYQINGKAEVIEKGAEYDRLFTEFIEKGIRLSAKRIVEGVDRGQEHKSFEVEISEKVVVLKIRIAELVEIMPSGELKREQMA